MGDERYADPDARRIGQQVEQTVRPHLPAWVAELRFETREDWTGDPAVYIWVILRDEVADPDSGTDVGPLRDRLFDAAWVADPGRWPYIRFRSVSEQAELDTEPAGAS